MSSVLLPARPCHHCNKEFSAKPGYASQLYCSVTCRKAATRKRRLERDAAVPASLLPAADLPSSACGDVNELVAAIHFQKAGYQVFRNLSSVGPADLMIWKPGSDPIPVDVKTGLYALNKPLRENAEQVYLVVVMDDQVFLPDDFPI